MTDKSGNRYAEGRNFREKIEDYNIYSEIYPLTNKNWNDFFLVI